MDEILWRIIIKQRGRRNYYPNSTGCLCGRFIEKQKELLTYLLNNQRRMQYKTYKDNGLFIGSGAIEAANKESIQKRFKLSEQR